MPDDKGRVAVVECYKTSDGKIHESLTEAHDHQDVLDNPEPAASLYIVDFRWRIGGGLKDTLQSRARQPVCDASGAICGFGEWSDWRDVPTSKCIGM